MKRLSVSLLGLLGAALIIVGCSQAAPAPAPTNPPAAPAATTAPVVSPPTAAPQAVLPTAAAAVTAVVPGTPVTDWPQKGKVINLIVPFSAGGSTDTQARLLAPLLEKELGTTVEVLSRPGAGSQVGLTELANAKPDGYTIGMTNNPTSMGVYLNPDRKSGLSMASFEPIAGFVTTPR